MTDLLEGLNQEQAQAVSAPPGPTLVVAGPGSGKTSVLTRRVAYLIQEMGMKPGQIMAVTFTNKAAREMQERIERILGERVRGVTVGTFHSICARILRREAAQIGYSPNYTIYDTDDQIAVIKQALSELNIDPKRYSPYSQLNKISAAKNELITPDQYVALTLVDKMTQQVYARYQQLLRISAAMDFDDLLMQTVVLFRQNPETLKRYQSYYRHVLVDEFQDTNTAQYQLVKLLAGGHQNLFVVGDPDQSIYRFRGAVPRNVQDFIKDYANVNLIRLGQNYRSHQLILDAATAVIRHNDDHIPITLTGQRSQGPRIIFQNLMTEEQEAAYIVEKIALYVAQGYRPRDCAVMYRVNAQSRALEEAFVRAGLPYRLVGGTRFYSRKEVKDVLAYLRLIHNPDDVVSLRRVINTPPRGLGDKSIQQLETWALSRQESMFAAIRALAQGEPGPFSARAEKSLVDFAALIDTWDQAKNTMSIATLLDDVLARTGYPEYLASNAKTSDEAEDRTENLTAFRGLTADYGDTKLSDFLEEVSLVADVENRDDNADAPTLLTLHAAKGLEFGVVFIAGLEEGTLPHQRALDDEEQMSEERRLMYVGITRAKDVLHLIWVMRRTVYGSSDYLMPSRFLADIPTNLTEGSPLPTKTAWGRSQQSYQQATTWTAPVQAAPRRQEKPSKYKSGQRVTHDKFGEGVVIASAIRSDVEELDIRFMDKKYGFKKIAADYVKPLSES